MYCSTCGVALVRGLTYCNHCGAKLTAESGNTAVKSSDIKPEALVWAMVAALVFGFGAIVLLMMAMKMVGLNVGQILAFTILSFLIVLVVESVFIRQLLGRKRGADDASDALSREEARKELNDAQARMLSEPMPSVTEHTTRAFEPIYHDRQK
ncbi:MAG TPA: hypothetical protein VFZ22_13035 [Pyrinomonadaceae bacterium]|nr:hypothetical protein [Pyrinomonadaceae bacterium]